MTKVFGALAIAVVLTGCASNSYMYDGKKYKGEDGLQTAVDQQRAANVAQITPLPAPLTSKSLVVIVPDTAAFTTSIAANYEKQLTRSMMPNEQLIARNLALTTSKGMMGFFEAVQKRGIYKSVEIREVASITPSAEPSAAYDVIYYSEPNFGTGQYYFASAKHGKQVFAYDMSGGTPQSRTLAFVEAIQALAIRN